MIFTVLSVVLALGAGVFLWVILRQNARIEELLRASREQLEVRRQVDTQGLADENSRRQSLESAVRALEARLKDYEQMLVGWEKDRAQKFGAIEKELSSAALATFKLQETTGKLNNVLGNVKLRGQWGERMAEDIITHAGLIEGVNYRKQTQLAASTTKPDITFLLPDNRSVNMDVKFPLDNYLKMVNAPSDLEREVASKEFIRNARARVKELQSRDYINPAENTLDFVLLFIPNEQVFGYIHEVAPEFMDEALKQKVVLCSPFTLYATLAVIRQAHENFRFERDMRKIIQDIEIFVKHYATFKDRFAGLEKLIADLEAGYNDIREKSFKNIDVKIRHIEEFRKGHLLSDDQDTKI
ncbi:MAG: DNA recombination protein RmuC [Candidatus Omnitrophica bacterium]|nr:DNA recombination protein RmuC [Candidatus Omnitrophota bacterium]